MFIFLRSFIKIKRSIFLHINLYRHFYIEINITNSFYSAF